MMKLNPLRWIAIGVCLSALLLYWKQNHDLEQYQIKLASSRQSNAQILQQLRRSEEKVVNLLHRRKVLSALLQEKAQALQKASARSAAYRAEIERLKREDESFNRWASSAQPESVIRVLHCRTGGCNDNRDSGRDDTE